MILFAPSWEYTSLFIQKIHKLIFPYHEIDQRTLDKNIASIIIQVLFSFILDTTQSTTLSLHAQNTLLHLAISSINADQSSEGAFLQRLSPPLFRYINSLCTYGHLLTAEAIQMLIFWFARHMVNTEYFWPWQKWCLLL